MPTAAPTACSRPGCPNAAVDRGRCVVHRQTTSERGYGPPHQRIRAIAIARYRPEDPCPRCGRPLGPDPSDLDMGHGPRQRGYSGLEHASCNRGARSNP